MPEPSSTKSLFVFQPIITDWLIPLLLLGTAGLGNKLSRTKNGWLAADFYVGPDLCLVAISTGLLRLFDLLRRVPVPTDEVGPFVNDVALCGLLIVMTFAIFLYVLTEHRELDGENPGRLPRLRLGIICNGLGLLCLTAFLLLIKPLA